MRYIFILIPILLSVLSCSIEENSEIVLLLSPPDTVYTYPSNYQISVKIYPENSVENLTLYYHLNHEESKYIDVKMDKDGDVFTANIDGPTYGNTIFYYIEGKNISKKGVRYPHIDETYLHFTVLRPNNYSCEYDFDCISGELCVENSCVVPPELCMSDFDCPGEMICNLDGGQVCDIPLNSCENDLNCDNSSYCHNNFCLSKGKSCEIDSDCNFSQSCIDNFCKLSQSCEDDSNCLENMVCNLEINRCIQQPECETDLDCENALYCNVILGLCVPTRCNVHLDCNPGELCDQLTKICVQSDQIECYSDNDCTTLPHCDEQDLKCKECLFNTHCGDEEICFNNECVTF